jgi:glycosyltransferase involved in cell wall biosynthesis/predicted metal-dependent phosphoesterase TrpH
MSEPVRCDLHVHSRFSTDSGNYALRRARLGESYTDPERVYRLCRARGMGLVTISDHNTVEGALRIAHLPDTFLSVEVTTRFAEDDVPLHVLVWGVTEEDHRDLQPYRPSVVELVAFLRERGLRHALAHPLYRMGPPLTVEHVERMMLLFSVWEGRNGARPAEANQLACRLAAAATPQLLARLAEKHGLAPAHDGAIALTGGSDDHGALDIGTTCTVAAGPTPADFLAAVARGDCRPAGEHGSTVKLAHALGALAVNAYREAGGDLSPAAAVQLQLLFDHDADAPSTRHEEIRAASSRIVRLLGGRAREGGLELHRIDAGPRLAALASAALVQLPYLATANHHAGGRGGLHVLARGFFGDAEPEPRLSALVFTDTLTEANGVAGTMRRLAGESARGTLPLRVAAAADADAPGVLALDADWTLPLPSYEQLELRFPILTDVLDAVERARPSVIHVATPGPVGVCGLVAAKLLGVPLVGSYHTNLGPYALHLTRDLLVAQALDLWVEWFYRRCDLVLAPTRAVASALRARGHERVAVWGRGVDTMLFRPERRSAIRRERLLDGGDLLLLSVGRLSREKRVDVLLEAFARLRTTHPGARLAVVGDGPARGELEAAAPDGASFLGELRDERLAEVFASCDVFCFPSTTDTFGQVMVEASASGLPVVAAAAGGAGELVRHGKTGLLVAPDDAAALADALTTLADDSLLRKRLARNALASAQSRTWERAFGELVTSYAAVAGAAAAAPRRAVA